jgi:hypothetical protein
MTVVASPREVVIRPASATRAEMSAVPTPRLAQEAAGAMDQAEVVIAAMMTVTSLLGSAAQWSADERRVLLQRL